MGRFGVRRADLPAADVRTVPRHRPDVRGAAGKADLPTGYQRLRGCVSHFHGAMKKRLNATSIGPIYRSPNFARACGRVLVGGHPDKRPDSRPGQDRDQRGGNPAGDDPGRDAAFRTLTSSRRRNRRTLLSPGDAT